MDFADGYHGLDSRAGRVHFFHESFEAGKNMSFQNWIRHHPRILTEGAVIERVRRGTGLSLDPHIDHAHWVFDDAGSEALAAIYRGYADVGVASGLPMIFFTPTWHANAARAEAAGHDLVTLNLRGVQFLRKLLQPYVDSNPYLFMLGGLMGVRNDSYRPEEGLPVEEASEYHRIQATALSRAGVDFLMAATVPSFSEARGLAHALAETGTPYIISFILSIEGGLLDRTPLHSAIATIDSETSPAPVGYLVNCMHPLNLREALEAEGSSPGASMDRLLGLQANASTCSPVELDGSDEVLSQEAVQFGHDMISVQREYGLRILGGCCGTTDAHIRAIAKNWIR